MPRWWVAGVLLIVGCAGDAGGDGGEDTCGEVASGDGDPDEPSELFAESCEVEVCCGSGELLSCLHYVDDAADTGAECEAECGQVVDQVRAQCGG